MAFIETRYFDNPLVGASGGPVYDTTVITYGSGKESRQSNWAYPLHRYNLAKILETETMFDEVVEVFHACKGRFHGFRVKDYNDYKSCPTGDVVTDTDQNIGTGDGVETEFQLQKTYTKGSQSTTRNITKPVSGTVVVAVAGSPVTPAAIDTTTGIVTLSVAPTAGQAVTAGFEFDVPVRFDIDTLENVMFINGELMRADTIPLVELRDA